MKDRIYKLRKETLNLSRAKFGEKIGMSDSEIKNIEYGITEIKENKIKLICSTYNVNEYWLRTGNGEMFEEKTDAEEIMHFAMEVIGGNPNSTQAKFIKAISKLTPEGWEVLQQIADAMAENKNGPDESDHE